MQYRLPLLLSFQASPDHELTIHQTIPLEGNVLDVAVIEEKQMILVSIDNVHEPGSTKESRIGPETVPATVHEYELVASDSTAKYQQMEWMATSKLIVDEAIWQERNLDLGMKSFTRAKGRGVYSELGEFLYGLENLRKNRGDIAIEEVAPDSDVQEELAM